MHVEKLKRLYKKKKVILDEAEVRAKKALIHSSREINAERVLFSHVQQLQKMHSDVATNIRILTNDRSKAETIKYVAKELGEALQNMAVLQHQARETLKDLQKQKKESKKNVLHLLRDFKKIGSIRLKMDKHLD